MENNLKNMFEHAIDIEMTAAKIYRQYEKMFQHYPDVAGLWRSLAKDEMNHAEILKESFTSLPSSVLDTTPGRLMWQNMVMIKQSLERTFEKKIENLDDALEVAHLIESSEINTIFKFLALEHFSTTVRKAFIESEIMDHQKKLMVFSRMYRSKDMRKKVRSRIKMNS